VLQAEHLGNSPVSENSLDLSMMCLIAWDVEQNLSDSANLWEVTRLIKCWQSSGEPPHKSPRLTNQIAWMVMLWLNICILSNVCKALQITKSGEQRFQLSGNTSCKISKKKLLLNNMVLRMMAREGSIVLWTQSSKNTITVGKRGHIERDWSSIQSTSRLARWGHCNSGWWWWPLGGE